MIDPTGEIPLLAAVGLVAGAVLVAGMVLNTILHFQNAKKIWGGLFQTNPDKSKAGIAWQIISRFTWELPQTILGLAGSHLTSLIGGKKTEVYYLRNGATVTNITPRGDSGFGLTLGSFEMGAYVDDKHESGHYHQSRVLGPLYIPLIAIPSLLHAWYFSIKKFVVNNILNPIKEAINGFLDRIFLERTHKGLNVKNIQDEQYYNFYTESWANKWSGWKK